MVWEFRNLGFDNHGLVAQRRGEQRQALASCTASRTRWRRRWCRQAQVEAATVRTRRAETELKAALVSYNGNLIGLSQTIRLGEVLQLVNRPQEAVAALQQLQQAYTDYFTSINDYNRAQFQLFRAMGYPAHLAACSDSFGAPMPVDASRPPQMAPVHAPPPCSDCPH